MELKEINLYGGAIKCKIPSEFNDLSNFLPVPDNQEVFVYHSKEQVDPSSRALSYDYVLSFEILQYLIGHNDTEAGRKLFDDLSYSNESRNSQICIINVIPGADLGLSEPFSSVSVYGTMEVCRSKYNKDQYDKITVLMYNYRMQRYKCEFLLSYTYPSESGISQAENEKMFVEVVKTLKVVDTNLFLV